MATDRPWVVHAALFASFRAHQGRAWVHLRCRRRGELHAADRVAERDAELPRPDLGERPNLSVQRLAVEEHLDAIGPPLLTEDERLDRAEHRGLHGADPD